jgi:hypothetical protein
MMSVMEYPEFSRLTKQTMGAFLDRIPARYQEGFAGALAAGEFRYGVKHLAMVVRRERVPVSAEEQAAFRRLLEYLGEPVEYAEEMTVD